MFGARLKELRTAKSMTQQDLAGLLNVSPSTVGMYEQGRRDPDTPTVSFLANYFNCTTDYLLGRTDDPTPPTTDSNQAAIRTIEAALEDDPELFDFFAELKEREDLQILFKQVKPLTPDTVRRIIRYIKMVEDEEAMES